MVEASFETATQKSGTDKKTVNIKYKMGNEDQFNEFDIEADPDMPADAVNSNVIIEEIEMNGKKQKVYRKTYQLVDGKTKVITRMEQM